MLLLGLNQVSGRLRGFVSGRVDVERLLIVVFATDAGDDDAPLTFIVDGRVGGGGCDEVGCECVGGWFERK